MSDVTVVIVAHDAAPTIDTALAGLAGQSAPPAAVVVVDDGSSDPTADLARSWETMLPLHVERLNENFGVGTARARVMAHVDTPLVATLDADDYWLTDHLSTLEASAGPRRLVVARDLLWSPGSWIRVHERTLPRAEDQHRAVVRGNISSAGVMFRRDDYERAGGYRESLRSSEDWDLYLRMVRDGVELVLAGEPTLLYRMDPTSTSAGYRTIESDVIVLEHARDEARDEHERAWVEDELQRRLARRSLGRAVDAAEQGRRAEARRHARAAMRSGAAKTRAIAAALAVAPTTASRARSGVSRRRWGA